MKNKHTIFYIIFIILLGLYQHEMLKKLALEKIHTTSSVSQLMCLGIVICTALYLLLNKKKDIREKHVSPISILNGTLLISFIIGIFWSLFKPFGSMATYFLLVMPLFVLNFSYTIVHRLEKVNLIIFCNIALLCFLLYAYFNYYEMAVRFLRVDESVTNASYILIYLLPILLCAKNKYIKIASFIGVFIAVAMSAKRGGMIAILLGLLVYLIVNNLMLKNEKHKVMKAVGLFVFLGFAIVSIQSVLESGDILIAQRLMQISETGGAGRDQIWVKTWEMFGNSDFPSYFLGHGYDQVVRDSPLKFSAHNDFLEILYDYGIPVFILYISFHVQLIKRILRMIKEGASYAAPLAFTYATFFVNSMVSHIFIYPYYMVIYAYIWGSILGLYHKDCISQPNNNIII